MRPFSPLQTSSSGTKRTLSAFGVAVAGATAVLWFYAIGVRVRNHLPLDFADLLSLLALLLVLSCIAAVLAGAPAFFILRRARCLSRSSCVISGAIAALLFFLIPYSMWYGFLEVLRVRVPELAASTVAGAVAGLIFSRVACSGNKEGPLDCTPSF